MSITTPGWGVLEWGASPWGGVPVPAVVVPAVPETFSSMLDMPPVRRPTRHEFLAPVQEVPGIVPVVQLPAYIHMEVSDLPPRMSRRTRGEFLSAAQETTGLVPVILFPHVMYMFCTDLPPRMAARTRNDHLSPVERPWISGHVPLVQQTADTNPVKADPGRRASRTPRTLRRLIK